MRVGDFGIQDKGSVTRTEPSRPQSTARPSGDDLSHADSTQISVLAQLLLPDQSRIEQLRTDVSVNRYSVAAAVVSHDLVTFYIEG